MKVHEDIYLTYIPTPAVLPYNTMIHDPKLKSTFTIVEGLDTIKFTTSFGAVCRTVVQMTWIPHAHRKPK